MKPLYQLSQHIYIFPYVSETDQPNLGYIQGTNASLLVDSGCGRSTTDALKKELVEHYLSEPDHVVMTHYHWDHSFGASQFDALAHASAFTCAKMEELRQMNMTSIDDMISDDLMPEFCREHLHLEYDNVSQLELRVPENIIDQPTLFDLGDVQAVVFPVVSPHCEGALLVYVEQDKVLFIGDADCGYIRGTEFIDDYEKLSAFFEVVKNIDFEKIVLGHIDVLSKEEYCAMVQEALDELRK